MQIILVDLLEGFTRTGPLADARVDALVTPQVEFLNALPPKSWVVFLANAINDYWFTQRFPAIWGARIVEHWQELMAPHLQVFRP